MTHEKFSFEQRQLILKAQQIIDDASANYGTILQQHVEQLHATLADNNIEDAIGLCYLIQSQAGTFGWPLATEVAGWFKKLLLRQKDNGLNPAVNRLFQDSLKQIVSEKMTGESNAALKLLQHIETTLRAGGNN